MVASDTTMTRSLGGFNCEKVREILGEAFEVSKKEEVSWITTSSGKRLRVGIVDGSDFGGILGAVLIVPGIVNVPLDIEPYTFGKELVLLRHFKQFTTLCCSSILLLTTIYCG